MPEPVVEEVPATFVTDVKETPKSEETPKEENPAEAEEVKDDEGTLLGKKDVEEVKETPEQKVEREKVELENKKLIETDDKDLNKEQIAKKQELIDAKLKTVPEKYEVKVPQGLEIDQVMIEKLTPILKKHNITQAAFNEIVEVYAPQIKAQIDSRDQYMQKEFKNIVSGWKTESIKELGADFKSTVSLAAKFIDKYGDDQFRTDLEETGLGNRISVIRALAKAGKAISQDSFPDSGKKIGGELTEQQKLDTLYPSMKS